MERLIVVLFLLVQLLGSGAHSEPELSRTKRQGIHFGFHHGGHQHPGSFVFPQEPSFILGQDGSFHLHPTQQLQAFCRGRNKRRPECQQFNQQAIEFPVAEPDANAGGSHHGAAIANCRGHRRNRPECQHLQQHGGGVAGGGGGGGGGNYPLNCKGKRQNRPECQIHLQSQASQNDEKVQEAFNQIPWLQGLTSNEFVSIPNLPGTPESSPQSRFYQLAFGVRDIPFQRCVTPQFEPGHCRFLQHCILPDFVSDFNVFLNYVCFIRGVYVGVCCPDSRYPSDATPPPPPTTVATTTLRPPTQPGSRGCGINSLQQTKIVGGRTAELNKYPWAAALLRATSSGHYCGGVLITKSHVLTAAHCVNGFESKAIIVRLGEYSFDQQSESPHKDFGVANIKMHENYDTTTYVNDMAILSLDRSTEFSNSIWPVCLPPAGDSFVGRTATVIGWGTIYFGGPVSPTLQEVSIPVWDNDVCDAAYKDNTVFPKNLCAGDKEGGKDSCQGDSGGPLMLQNGPEKRWTVIGVVSWGIRCAEPELPGVYARVSEFLDWIAQNTA